jgi:hypothetical protein
MGRPSSPAFPNSRAGTSLARNVHAPAPAVLARARRPGFISVNGQCSVRSALLSDMRQSKRISGVAAATVPPHAPMNSPVCRLRRPGFLSNLCTFIDVI